MAYLSLHRLKKQHTSPKARRQVQMYSSIVIGVVLGSVMMMSLSMNGADSYDLEGLTLPRRLAGVWPPPVPGFQKNNDADKPDYEHTSVYQGTITQHVGNVLLCIPYAMICFYMLVGLNTVCDAYFTGALDCMVKKWNVAPDVAGATFMAAGGSAPEFFTSIIGACLAESDVGFGTIVGSAVFNVLFVIGACGIAAKEAIPLTWWPLFRDCSFYIVGLGLLALFASTRKDGRNYEGRPFTKPNIDINNDGKKDGCNPIPGIEHWEAAVLFLLYLCYCLMMVFNESLQRRFTGQPKKSQVAPDQNTETKNSGGGKLEDAADAKDPPPASGDDAVANKKTNDKEEDEPPETKVEIPETGRGADKTAETKVVVSAQSKDNNDQAKYDETGEQDKADGDGDDDDDDDEDDIEEMMTIPEDTKGKIMWYMCSPIYAHLYYCTPKPSLDKKCNCLSSFIACFLVSLLWIAIYSLILVWLVTEIGAVFGFPEIIMGFTILAAGTSIPDLVSSMAVAREGEGDMAVSSSIGSNIFDILVGLPIPWLIKILLVEGAGRSDPNFLVVIRSPYIPFYVLLLLGMVAAVVITIHLMKWRLNKWLGVVMVILYVIFLGIVLPTSYDAFTFLNFANDGRTELTPQECGY